jgi:hypothetical protein
MASYKLEAVEAAKEAWRNERGRVECPACGSEAYTVLGYSTAIALSCRDCRHKRREH